MRREGDRVRLLHMRDATRQALDFTRGRSRADLDSDAMFRLALTRLLEIIGEAARHVSEPTRALAPDIPWRQVAATRNRIIHGYSDVNLNLVWDILTQDLPELGPALERLLARLDR